MVHSIQFIEFQVFFINFTIIFEPLQECNDGLGVCTKFHLCSNSTVFNDGRGKLNTRFSEDNCHYNEMCCDPEDVVHDEKGRDVS